VGSLHARQGALNGGPTRNHAGANPVTSPSSRLVTHPLIAPHRRHRAHRHLPLWQCLRSDTESHAAQRSGSGRADGPSMISRGTRTGGQRTAPPPGTRERVPCA
jgi:hypothetical protein